MGIGNVIRSSYRNSKLHWVRSCLFETLTWRHIVLCDGSYFGAPPLVDRGLSFWFVQMSFFFFFFFRIDWPSAVFSFQGAAWRTISPGSGGAQSVSNWNSFAYSPISRLQGISDIGTEYGVGEDEWKESEVGEPIKAIGKGGGDLSTLWVVTYQTKLAH